MQSRISALCDVTRGTHISLNKVQSKMSFSRMLNLSIFVWGCKQRAQYAAGFFFLSFFFFFLGGGDAVLNENFNEKTFNSQNDETMHLRFQHLCPQSPATGVFIWRIAHHGPAKKKMEIAGGYLWCYVSESDAGSPFLTSASKMKTSESDLANPRQRVPASSPLGSSPRGPIWSWNSETKKNKIKIEGKHTLTLKTLVNF